MATRTRRRPAEEQPTPRRAVPQLLPLISELFIVTKDLRIRRLGDVMKPAQRDFIARCQRQLDTRGQIRACVLKARQLGLSTIIEAIAYVLSKAFDHYQSLVVSHEDKSSTHLLGMSRFYWQTDVFRRFYAEQYNGRNHLAWTNGSDMHVATAKNTDAGASTTIQCLHGSEVARWPDAETLMTALFNAVPSFGLTCIFLESTAQGVGNWFHQQCNASMKGQSEYEFFFYPWYLEPEYTAAYLPENVRDQYALLGELDEEEKALAKMKDRHGNRLIDDARLLWRRWHIANRCGGDVDKFHQEMPTTPHEAFIATGRNVFRWPRLRAHYHHPQWVARGKVMQLQGRYKFVDDPQGPLTVFSHPADDREWGVYLIGGDPTHAPGGDFACMQVLNRRTLEQVAVYRRKIDPITFGNDMAALGHYYNTALVAPEATGPGYATVGCLVKGGYPNIYLRQHVEKMQGIPLDIAGWVTNEQFKELAIAHLVKLFSEPVAVYGDEVHGLVIHDNDTLIELRDYVTLEKGLGYGNADGTEYDDGVMALAIAAAVHAIEPKPPAFEFTGPPEPKLSKIRRIEGGSFDPRPRDRPVEAPERPDDYDEPAVPWEGIEHWAINPEWED